MDSDEERKLPPTQSRQYAALRSDLSAALAAFDRAQDWADLIHDLQRVNRVLNKHANSSFLPDKYLLAKRLAQCLTSFLPSGVHLKALETYHIIFNRIGASRLARHLPLYAGGLFPLLSHCSTSLKAPLLSLYETHFLPLGTSLTPVLDGFVLAILPGLDDETSEFYSRSRAMLDNVAGAVADAGAFGRSLWRALLLSPPARFAASHYLRSKLSGGDHNLRTHMVGDMPLVAYAITAALSDTDTLTQRSVLDLLLGELALDAPFFRTEGPDQRDAAIALVGGVFGTLLRRDISLTKRVHAWFLGGKDADAAVEFCNSFSKHLVLAAVDKETDASLADLAPKEAKVATRPCKIAVALLDRPELCDCLGHLVALRILNFGRLAIARGHAHAREISNSITDLLQDFGSARIFEELERVLADGKETTHEDFELLSFSLSMFPTKDHVVRRKHLPALLQVAVRSLNAVSADTLILDKAVGFCSKAILSMGLSKDLDIDESLSDDIKRIVSVFASFFVAWLAHVVPSAPPELRRAYMDVSVSEEFAAEVHMASVCEERKEVIRIAKSACAFFVTVAVSGIGGADTRCVALHTTAKCACAADVRISLAGAKAFADVAAYVHRGAFAVDDRDEQSLGVIRRCWRQMHPSLQTATAQSAQCLLALQMRFPDEVNIVIADGILSPILSRRLRNLERFACLWRLSVEHRLLPLPADNGLFLMLDALTDEHWGPKMLARSWLSDALEVDPASVIDAPLRLLLTSESRTVGMKNEFAAVYDAPRALYAFQTLRSIFESCPTIMGPTVENSSVSLSPTQLPSKGPNRGRTGIRALAVTSPSPRSVQALAAVFAVENGVSLSPASNASYSGEGPVVLSHLLPAHNYVVAMALVCLGYLRGHVPERFCRKVELRNGFGELTSQSGTGDSLLSEVDDDLEWTLAGLGSKSMVELHDGVCAAAAECLATLLAAIPVPSQMSSIIANLFAEPLLCLIRQSVGVADPVLELHFLNAMNFLVTADGPCYLSSIQGKDTFAKVKADRRRVSYADGHNPMHIVKRIDQGVTVQVGAAESLDSFIPWLLSGVAAACRNDHMNHDSGSQEVLGVRRRWIQFMDTVMKHVGVSIPVVMEGLLLILCELLKSHDAEVSTDRSISDSELSRVDETLVLLQGLAVVTSNVLWSFEHALSGGDLRDSAQPGTAGQTLEPSTRSLPALQAKDANALAGSDSSRATGSNTHIVQQTQSAVETVSSSGSNNLIDKASSVTNATSAVINALNPLRMINDFVKDVLIGGGSDGTHRILDPRRSGARVLFCHLPSIITNVARVWGPSPETQNEGETSTEHLGERAGPPRLSTELPRERRQAQRASVISILEPIFELRPVDLVASIITMFYIEQDEFGALSDAIEHDSLTKMACHMLHSMSTATPEAVTTCVKTIFEKAMKWDSAGPEAAEGRAQAMFRQQADSAIKGLISKGPGSMSPADIASIGKMAANHYSSPLPGGAAGIDLGQANGNGNMLVHQELFHWGDFFAVFPPGSIETACLNFLDVFLATSTDGDDTQGAWSLLYSLLRDAVTSAQRKRVIPAVLRVIGTFVSKNPSPFPERRIRREIMVVSALAISSCASVAHGNVDVSREEHGNATLFKKKMAIVALKALSTSVPLLVDSAFLEEKQQLSSSVGSSAAPAVAALKKASSRAAAIHVAATSVKHKQISGESSPRHEAETAVDTVASEAAAEVILNIGSRDWGVKLARRELLGLLEDSNFFYGKNRAVLKQMSAIVKEVIANGGASFLLSSLGTSSSNAAPGIPNLFMGRDSETIVRARAIHRMAYCVFVSEPDFYSPQMPFVLEKIRDALRMTDSALVGECLFCLRALLLRTGPSSISAFRASILSELFRITAKPTEDLKATLSAVRFLDLVTLISPPDYGYERCFFFGEQSGTGDESFSDDSGPSSVSSSPSFVPLVANVAALWTGDTRDRNEIFKPPLRLEAGRTLLSGFSTSPVNASLIGRYAAGLLIRNSLPQMKAALADRLTICEEFEAEFLEGPVVK